MVLIRPITTYLNNLYKPALYIIFEEVLLKQIKLFI